MILSLHRRFPDGDHWEIDPTPIGSITMEQGQVKLDMRESPVKAQIQSILSRPITYLGGLFDDDAEDTVLRVIDRDSGDYNKALIYELRRFGIEARERIPAGV